MEYSTACALRTGGLRLLILELDCSNKPKHRLNQFLQHYLPFVALPATRLP